MLRQLRCPAFFEALTGKLSLLLDLEASYPRRVAAWGWVLGSRSSMHVLVRETGVSPIFSLFLLVRLVRVGQCYGTALERV